MPRTTDREQDADDQHDDHELDELLGVVRPIIAAFLYICSTEPDVVDPDRPGARPRRAARPAEKPQVWEVGYRIGTALKGEDVPRCSGRTPQRTGGTRPPGSLAHLLAGPEVRSGAASDRAALDLTGTGRVG